MPRYSKSGPCGQRGGGGADAPRVSIYAEVTDRIIAELEAGRIPWVQPWSNAAARPDLPANAVTGRAYSGINILCLWGAVIKHGFAAQRWLTFAQARNAGGMVRKGEHGTQVVFANRFMPKGDGAGGNGNGGNGSGGAANADVTPGSENGSKAIPFLKRFLQEPHPSDLVELLRSRACQDALPPRQERENAYGALRLCWQKPR
ncbi:DUF1738 domain-containing protein [Sphingomonas paeninsulae]|uniref:DUF1738 domain-containing protein n=1 Tax=Sphingomonas paeninsulae TaxID=2319844 RepID=A0A494TQM9_SPHPE|nr:DUF1738 domain-containing protein [Sphingomonas paeninsulae]